MSKDERPPNWDWVKARHECRAEHMFKEVQVLAQRNVDRRNGQVEGAPFKLTEVNGIEFYVTKSADLADRVFFKVTDDLKQIVVSPGPSATAVARYTVALDETGVCKFVDEGETRLDAWQVLEAALKPLMFP